MKYYIFNSDHGHDPDIVDTLKEAEARLEDLMNHNVFHATEIRVIKGEELKFTSRTKTVVDLEDE